MRKCHKEDIRFAYTQIKRFAEAQRKSLSEFDIKTEPGVRLGQRIVCVECAGGYAPGMKFLKIITWQEITPEANKEFSATASRISPLEGMDGHARACDWRLRKYFPGTNLSFDVTDQKRYE